MAETEKHGETASKFKALGDPVRLRILELLPKNSCACEMYNVGELAEVIGLSQPSISHHLRVLKQAGFLRSKKLQRDVYYWIDGPAIQEAMDQLTDLWQE